MRVSSQVADLAKWKPNTLIEGTKEAGGNNFSLSEKHTTHLDGNAWDYLGRSM
jgi:hypothetical protein